MKTKQITLVFKGAQTVNGIMKLVIADVTEAVKVASSDPAAIRTMIVELKELVAVAEEAEYNLSRRVLR